MDAGPGGGHDGAVLCVAGLGAKAVRNCGPSTKK